jgi:gluconokinase
VSVDAPCALIVMGVSGSGKSTVAEKLAQRLGWTYEDGDRFHPASNVAKMSAGHHGTQELIAGRLAARKGHFMPPGLLASQFKTLEPPGADENPVIVSIDASVTEIVDDTISQMGLTPAISSPPPRNRS